MLGTKVGLGTRLPQIDYKRIYVGLRRAQARYTLRLQNSSMSMMVTARCRACSVAVPKSDQRHNLANPASQRVAPTLVDCCILNGRWLSRRTTRSCACHASGVLKSYAVCASRSIVEVSRIHYHVTAPPDWLCPHSSRVHGNLAYWPRRGFSTSPHQKKYG